MTISEFMKSELHGIKEIIASIPGDEFDSHEFIRIFAKKYEIEYVEFLYQKKQDAPFKTVHQQIGRFLLSNREYLNIEAIEKCCSKNVFGVNSENEKWKKV